MKVQVQEDSPYAPIRYEATRRYARPLGRLFIAHAIQGEKTRLKFIKNELSARLREEVGRIGQSDGPGPVQSEIGNIQIFGEFDAGGRIIFDVARPLTKSLLLTDAKDIPCSELVFPAKSFYLHFGRGTGLQNDAGEIEGAFISHKKDLLHIDLVPAFFGQPLFFALPMGEQLVGANVDLSQNELTVLSALDISIDNTLKANREHFEQLAGLEAQLTAQYGEIMKVPSTVERLEEKAPLLREALQLIVNTMFYLAAEPEDTHEGWASDAPATLTDQAQDAAAKPGTRKAAENRLKNMGYLKVQYVGQHYGASSGASGIEEAFATGRVLATHIRRGHYRRQPYGPENALRKRIFVAPVVINANRSGESPGRIYEA